MTRPCGSCWRDIGRFSIFQLLFSLQSGVCKNPVSGFLLQFFYLLELFSKASNWLHDKRPLAQSIFCSFIIVYDALSPMFLLIKKNASLASLPRLSASFFHVSLLVTIVSKSISGSRLPTLRSLSSRWHRHLQFNAPNFLEIGVMTFFFQNFSCILRSRCRDEAKWDVKLKLSG